MTSGLPPVGVRAVIEGFDLFMRQSGLINGQFAAMGRSALQLQNDTTRAFGALGSTIGTTQGLLVGFGVAGAGALLAVGVASEKMAAQYNQNLGSIQAVTGATTAQIAKLDQVQVGLVSTTGRTLSQTEALSQALVRDGVSIDKVNDSVLKAANS